jgi:hypothetical protein
MSSLQTADSGQTIEEPLYPTRILRLGAMIESLLVEIRHVPLDPAARELLSDIYHRSVGMLSGALPPDLDQELDDLLPSLGTQVPSQAELRIAHAQLHGWLAGLLQGLQVASVSQHLEAHRQLAELRHASERAVAEESAAADRRNDAAYL